MCILLALKAPISTAVDDSLEYYFPLFFSGKIRLDISCKFSARQRQRIHMKHQALCLAEGLHEVLSFYFFET